MVGASCPHAVYPQFPQAISSTATEQRCSGQRVGDNLWIPRGILEESTGCPRIHAQCAQLAGIWGPNWGRAVDAVWTTKPVHSRPRFILELSPGHPQADTRCELRKPAESTVSTGPITTPVLHLENFSSKQVVWTSLERTAPPDGARRETRTAGEIPESAAVAAAHGSPLPHRSPNRSAPEEPDSFPSPHRGAYSTVRGTRVTVRPVPLTSLRGDGTRTHDRSHTGQPPAARPPCHIGGKSGHRSADEKSNAGHRTRERVPNLSTPLPRDDCGYGHTTGAREYRPPHAPRIHRRPHPLFIHSGTQVIRPDSGDTVRSVRPAWPGHRRRTYPPLGGAADRVARNGVRSDVGRLCQTPGAAGPVFRPPHRPPCPAPVAESAQRDTRGQHSRRSTLNGRGHLGRWTLQA